MGGGDMMGRCCRILPGFMLCLLLVPGAASADLTLPSGFEQVGKLESYTPANAFEAINGAAEAYIAAGMTSLRMATVRKTGKKPVEVALRVFGQKRPIDAFGLFHKQRGDDAKPLTVGAGGAIMGEDLCVSFDGAWYLEVRPIAEALTPELCTALMSGVHAALPTPHGLPPEAALLPAEGRKPGSLGFTRASYLGTRDLKNCLHAEYADPADARRSIQRFVMLVDGAPDAALGKLGTKWKRSEESGRAVWSRSIPYRGVIVLAIASGRIVGVAGPETLAQAVKALPQP